MSHRSGSNVHLVGRQPAAVQFRHTTPMSQESRQWQNSGRLQFLQPSDKSRLRIYIIEDFLFKSFRAVAQV